MGLTIRWNSVIWNGLPVTGFRKYISSDAYEESGDAKRKNREPAGS